MYNYLKINHLIKKHVGVHSPISNLNEPTILEISHEILPKVISVCLQKHKDYIYYRWMMYLIYTWYTFIVVLSYFCSALYKGNQTEVSGLRHS